MRKLVFAVAQKLRFRVLNGLTFRLERAIRWSRLVSASPGGRFAQTRMVIRA